MGKFDWTFIFNENGYFLQDKKTGIIYSEAQLNFFSKLLLSSAKKYEIEIDGYNESRVNANKLEKSILGGDSK